MKRRAVAIVGCGQIGSRHLQALLKIPAQTLGGLDIHVVDPSPQSRTRALNRAREIIGQETGDTEHEVHCSGDFSTMPAELDLAIFASTSRHRYEAFRGLAAVANPASILFEKFLFDRREHYAETGDWLKARGIPSWVHCPRPYWPDYRQLGAGAPTQDIRISVSGKNYNLASNCVHFFDLFRFLAKRPVSAVRLERETFQVTDHKHSGYREIFGAMIGSGEGVGGEARLACDLDEGAPLEVTVELWHGDDRLVIAETKGTVTRHSALNGKSETRPFESILASANTAMFEDILLSQNPLLPTYAEAAITHLAVFDALEEMLVRNGTLPVT